MSSNLDRLLTSLRKLYLQMDATASLLAEHSDRHAKELQGAADIVGEWIDELDPESPQDKLRRLQKEATR